MEGSIFCLPPHPGHSYLLHPLFWVKKPLIPPPPFLLHPEPTPPLSPVCPLPPLHPLPHTKPFRLAAGAGFCHSRTGLQCAGGSHPGRPRVPHYRGPLQPRGRPAPATNQQAGDPLLAERHPHRRKAGEGAAGKGAVGAGKGGCWAQEVVEREKGRQMRGCGGCMCHLACCRTLENSVILGPCCHTYGHPPALPLPPAPPPPPSHTLS